MPDLTLINARGVSEAFSGVETIVAPTSGGGTATFYAQEPTTVEPLSVTANGTYNAPTGKAYSPVTVNVRVEAVAKKDVNFYDYDGTIVSSYSAADFANLTALPDNPSHTGLTAQGWNWTLADAKTYVASYGKLDVGQMYITDDGKTRIYIRLEDGRLAPYLGIAINGTATVDWGDGTSSTVTGSSTSTVVNTQHTYAAAGDYVIAIAVSGSMALVGDSIYGSQVLWKNSTTGNLNRTYQNAIQKVEIGTNTSIGTYAFRYCYSLASITLPSGVTSIGDYAFSYCYGLGYIKFERTTPPTVSNSSTWTNVPTDCIIYVPAGTLSVYTSATNYPDPSTYTYVEYDL